MCLVALAWKSHPRWRLLLAGNRDEFHQRPTAALSRWPGPAGITAGRDLQSGGTWVGVDPQGRCAVVTNVRDPRAPATGATSRGALPTGYLESRSTAATHANELIASAGEYAPFNLLLADATSCEYLGNHPRATRETLMPGIHGMSNGGLNAGWPKTHRLREAMEAWSRTDATDPAALWEALANEQIADDSELPDTGVGLALERLLSPAFIRGPQYGTRASTLIAIDYQGQGWISERRFSPNGVFEGGTTLPITQRP